jgi:hypothetical protein
MTTTLLRWLRRLQRRVNPSTRIEFKTWLKRRFRTYFKAKARTKAHLGLKKRRMLVRVSELEC